MVIIFLIVIIPFDYSISALLKEEANFYLAVHWALFHFEFSIKEMKPFVKIRIFRRIIMDEPIKKESRKKR